MLGGIIIEDEDADRYLIDVALQLSQQSEANNGTKYNYKLSTQLVRDNRKHGPQLFSIFPIPHTKILPPSILAIFNAVYIINYLAAPDDPPSMQLKCYMTILRHNNTDNLLSNFNALHTFPKKFHMTMLSNHLSNLNTTMFHSSLQCNEHVTPAVSHHKQSSIQ